MKNEDDVQVVTAKMLELAVSSTFSSFDSLRRFDKSITISELKGKLELLTGASTATMTIEVYNKDNKIVCNLDESDRLLGSYQIDSGMRLHVVDRMKNDGDFEDVSKVEKFELSKEEYEKRTERNRMGRFNPELVAKKEAEMAEKERLEDEAAKRIQVDSRCEVRTTGQPTRRATVKFVGPVDFKPGQWVGVAYDEPLGKNNGTVQGKSYFTCPERYGGFVRPTCIEVGDFPEAGFSDDDMEM